MMNQCRVHFGKQQHTRAHANAPLLRVSARASLQGFISKKPLECVYIKCSWRVRAYTQVAQAGTNCDHTAHTTVFQLHIKVRFGEAATTTERQLAGQNGEQT